MNDMRQQIREAPDMSDIQPKQRKMAGGKQKNNDEDADWGDTGALLD